MAHSTQPGFAEEVSSSVVKATTSPSSGMDDADTAVIAGVIAAVVVTIVIVLALTAIYLYKHKGSYRTHEMMQEGEADKALHENDGDPSEEKQEYFM